MSQKASISFINRDVSWLHFNERVLQEAMDPSVPLIERIRFLGIFSNNRDEFFRVRVAALRRMNSLSTRHKLLLDDDPSETLDELQKIVEKQQKQCDKIYQKLTGELKQNDIFLVNEQELTLEQEDFVREYFEEMVRPELVPIMLEGKNKFPYLRDEVVYLAVKLFGNPGKKNKHALIELPTDNVSRFLVLPQVGKKKYLMLLDDVIRVGLDQVFSFFNYRKIEAYTIKLTRDAELDFTEDLSESFIDKVSKSLKKRKVGFPVRFIYDEHMPEDLYKTIRTKQGRLQDENVIAGGRYHNFKDFINFPDIGAKALRNRVLKPLEHKDLRQAKSILAVLSKQDVLLSYPYQSFNYVIDVLREAAIDPSVKSIKINLYRVAKNSKVVNTLVNAVKNGKKVTAVIELRARFDEKANIYWSNKLSEGGVKVITGIPSFKIHSKLILIRKKQGNKIVNFAHVGTGNFHEKTAQLYADVSLFTSDIRITSEVDRVFSFIENPFRSRRFSHLLVSPINTRRKFIQLINHEIKNATAGKEAYIIIKLNNLVDKEMIKKLYEASNSGVKIKLLIRGICALVPGVKGLSENIEALSIVDRFLEHSRVIVFCNNGNTKYFIASADWMRRNLDKRIEVTVPIYDKRLQQTLKDLLEIQLNDNCKARLLDKQQKNKYKLKESSKTVRSQIKTYQYFQDLIKEE